MTTKNKTKSYNKSVNNSAEDGLKQILTYLQALNEDKDKNLYQNGFMPFGMGYGNDMAGMGNMPQTSVYVSFNPMPMQGQMGQNYGLQNLVGNNMGQYQMGQIPSGLDSLLLPYQDQSKKDLYSGKKGSPEKVDYGKILDMVSEYVSDLKKSYSGESKSGSKSGAYSKGGKGGYSK